MALVEVVRGQKTSDQVFDAAMDLVRKLGKTPVAVNRDIPMFVMNRIFGAAFDEAADLVALGIASAEDVDTGMKLGYGWTAGPFQIADNAGLDTWVRIMETMDKLEVRPVRPGRKMLEKLVAEGRLGRKVGRGFYSYDKAGRRI